MYLLRTLLSSELSSRVLTRWWSCLPCLKLNLCPTHAVVLSSAGAPGRAELQRRLAYAQAQVKKAEMKAASLKRALKRIVSTVQLHTER